MYVNTSIIIVTATPNTRKKKHMIFRVKTIQYSLGPESFDERMLG